MAHEELELVDDDTKVTVIATEAIGVITKSEVEAQLDAAHRYPRAGLKGDGITRFLQEAVGLATLDAETAMSCIYALPRGGKVISGPSVRLAEMCASAYRNLHMGARVVGTEEKEVIAQGICWDLEANNRVTVEVRRRIFDKYGKRYNDDMITVTGSAAASIGLRNAIFRVIPKSLVNHVYQKAREAAVGNALTFSAKRSLVVERLTKMGILQERILARAGKASIDDITMADMEMLIALGTSIKEGTQGIDEAFPAKEAPKGNPLDAIVDKETARKTAVDEAAALTRQLEESLQKCTDQDFSEIETLAHQCGIFMKEVEEYITKTMGFDSFLSLTKGRKPEVLKWIQARRKNK